MRHDAPDRRLDSSRKVGHGREGGVDMDHHAMELIGRRQTADWRREADANRLVRTARDRQPARDQHPARLLHPARRLLEPAQRLVRRLAPAT